jgi:MerR family transcriptional regulator, thiopeptide resistance regulator
MEDATYTVGEAARLAHVSVRTLHHYEEVGLLCPSRRSEAGYRLYTLEDLETLQQVLFYKELGFSLDDIRELMSDPAFDRREALLVQRELIAEQTLRLEALLDLIDRTIDATDGGVRMTKEEMFEVFGDFDPSEHENEARERWGDSDAYKESARRAARYTKQDWQRFKDESEEINAAVVELMDAGAPADDPRVMDALERARMQIDTWFYPCSREMHAGLGRMYIADPRFTATYEKIRPGLAQYMCDAILANAERGKG